MQIATGGNRTYSIPGKTAVLVPEFAVENLLSAELQNRFLFCNEGPALGQNTNDGNSISLTIKHILYVD